jgi:hypothetical protein
MSQSTESPQMQSSPSAAVTPNDPKRPIFENASDDAADRLSPKQWQALELLAAGKRVSQVVAESGVSRKTLYRWRHEDADFIAELRARRRELFDGAADRLAALLPRAVKVLALHLSDASDPASFRAATAILRVANIKELLAADDDDDDDADGGKT